MIFLFCLGLLQDTTLSDTADVIRYQAKSITYDLEKSVIILKDSSVINYEDIQLFSDSAHYYIETNHLEAFGKCDLRQMNDSIKGDFLKYNINNKKALMTNGKTQIDKGFLTGDEIYWIDEKTVNSYHGKYTTCSDSPPHYYFYSPKMKVYLGDMVIARPLYLYIQDIPVLGAPFWFVPISSKRKSGLLPFRIGNSSTFGKYIRDFAYYLVLSDYADVTFQLDALEKKGVMPHVEGVWDFTPYSKGRAYASYIRDTETEQIRYSVEARNNSTLFLLGSSLNFDIKYVSDNSYRQDYAETTAIWLEREITSQATLTRTLAGYKNTVSFERREDFTDSIVNLKLPYYTLSGPSSMLLSAINYSVSGHISRDRVTTNQDTSEVIGANLHTTPTVQQNVFNLFSLSPKLDLDLALFNEDTAGNEWPTRFGYSFATTASTNLFRVFNFELLGLHGLLHKVLPSITYTYTPKFDFTGFPSATGIPAYGYTNSLGFSLNQELEAKIGDELKKNNVLRLNLNTTYDLISDSLSVISFLASAPYNPFPAPISSFSVQITGNIDPYTRDYTYNITNTAGIKFDFLSLNVSQSYRRGGTYQIWFNGDLKPTKNWSITYSARYDWDTKNLIDYSLGLVRDLHCWEAMMNLNQLGDDWRYDFKIRIKTIPEVSIGKGLLGYLFE
ncbi:MAG: putative LPS assembly protein LptD [candidate division WOR-3 bacterium]|jgi:lipopolysaccharide assembly outer membrane protein LptD (OstA)